LNSIKIIKFFLPHGIIIYKKIILTKILSFYYYFKVKSFHIRENTALLIEFYTFHGEILPGLIKYLFDLGYNVDIIFSKSNNKDRNARNDAGLFSCFNGDERLRTITLSNYGKNTLLRSSKISYYRNIIIGTFNDGTIRNELYNIDLFKLKPVCMVHDFYVIHNYINTNKIVTLVKMEYPNRKPHLIVNAHYFGKYQKRAKSKKTVFITLNSNNLFNRNLYLLFKACDTLYQNGINNFSVKIIGQGIAVPERFLDNFQVFGFLDYPNMFKETADSDFFLALIDQASIQYTNKASGSYQLSYGFLKPIVLHRKYSCVSGFNDKNSILYNDNDDLSEAMIKCINMPDNDYSLLVNELEISEKELYTRSLNNLKEALEASI